ncbi:hypothetical protein FRC04_004617 [Tulasnella sp. 424]|nr:hypothetical protein FRC04_004617 [Tulasnella sp. 424]
MEGFDDDAVAAPVFRREAEKRKDNPMDVDTMEGSVAKKSKSKKPDRFNGSMTAEAPNPPARRSKNTAVYVSPLPPDVTVDELRDAKSHLTTLSRIQL